MTQNPHGANHNLENDLRNTLFFRFPLFIENFRAKNKNSVVFVDWKLFNYGQKLKFLVTRENWVAAGGLEAETRRKLSLEVQPKRDLDSKDTLNLIFI